MYELVIAIGQDYIQKCTLLRGTYADICMETSNYDGTSDIRNSSKYKDIIDKFLSNKNTNGQVVVLEYNNKSIIRHRVLYKSDIKLFNKLLSIPNKNDIVFKEWINYWCFLRYGIKAKVFKDENINQKVLVCEDKFNANSYLFNRLLNKLPLWYIYSFNPREPLFSNSFFAQFRKLIKQDVNMYYDLASVVLSSYDTYEKICRLYGLDTRIIFEKYHKIKNYNKNKVKQKCILQHHQMITGDYSFNNVEIKDEFGRYSTFQEMDSDYLHSNEYLLLKPYIENNNFEFLKTYLNNYHNTSLTNEEYDSIKHVLKGNR